MPYHSVHTYARQNTALKDGFIAGNTKIGNFISNSNWNILDGAENPDSKS